MRLLNRPDLKEGSRVEDVVLEHVVELAVKSSGRIGARNIQVASEPTDVGGILSVHGRKLRDETRLSAFPFQAIVERVVVDEIDLDVGIALDRGRRARIIRRSRSLLRSGSLRLRWRHLLCG